MSDMHPAGKIHTSLWIYLSRAVKLMVQIVSCRIEKSNAFAITGYALLLISMGIQYLQEIQVFQLLFLFFFPFLTPATNPILPGTVKMSVLVPFSLLSKCNGAIFLRKMTKGGRRKTDNTNVILLCLLSP